MSVESICINVIKFCKYVVSGRLEVASRYKGWSSKRFIKETICCFQSVIEGIKVKGYDEYKNTLIFRDLKIEFGE